MTTPKTAALAALDAALAALDAAYVSARAARTAVQAVFPVGHQVAEEVDSLVQMLQSTRNNTMMRLRPSAAAERATKVEV
jgi:hypothetical protein